MLILKRGSDNMNPQVFGKEHLIYVIVSVLTAVIVCVLSKLFLKTEKSKNIVIKASALILFVIIFTNRIALVFEYNDVRWMEMITDSVCSTSSYVLSLALLFGKKNNGVLHFIWLIALGGGMITTFYPNFIDQHPSFLYPPTILGMMHHTWSAIVVLLMFVVGHLKLTYKKWYCTLIGFVAYLSYGFFLMKVLKFNNPFYMTAPAIDGTIFTIWVVIPIYLVVYSIILLIVELVRIKKEKITTNIERR